MRFETCDEETAWWHANDRQAVLDVMEELRPLRCLEFGPGSSTLALIAGGAQTIHCVEDDPEWERVYRSRLQGVYPKVVSIVRYVWNEPLSIPLIDGRHYDLALIDGPRGTPRRPAAIEYCLQRCDAVLFPTEDHGREHKSVLQPFAKAMADKYGKKLTIKHTGPLSGSFALLR